MLGLNSKAGLFAAILHIINHSIIKTSLFMAVGCVSYKFDSTKVENLSGLKKSMPHTALAFTLLSLALIGVPLTCGFVSKYMLKAIIESHAWISLIVFDAGSFLALIYMWKMVEKMHFGNDAASHAEIAPGSFDKVPLLMLFCLLLMAALTVVTGVYSTPIWLAVEKLAF